MFGTEVLRRAFRFRCHGFARQGNIAPRTDPDSRSREAGINVRTCMDQRIPDPGQETTLRSQTLAFARAGSALLCRCRISERAGHGYQRANGDRHRRSVRTGRGDGASPRAGRCQGRHPGLERGAGGKGCGTGRRCRRGLRRGRPGEPRGRCRCSARAVGSGAHPGCLRRHRSGRQADRAGRQGKPARTTDPCRPGQPDRHHQLLPAGCCRHDRTGTDGGQRTRLHHHHRFCCRLRGTDRAARLRPPRRAASQR